MIGYHYTSKEHWEAIKKEGLKPSLVKNVEVYQGIPQQDRPAQIFGIWVWKRKQPPLSHFGNLIRVASVFNTTDIVLISVEYDDSDIFTVGKYRQRLNISHAGNIENLIYHKNEEATILQNAIPIEQIRLQRHYDLVKLTNG